MTAKPAMRPSRAFGPAIFLLGVAFGASALSAQSAPLGSVLREALAAYMDQGKTMCVGWSPDGKFAAFHDVYVGGRGGFAIGLVIVDSVTDAVLFDKELWADEFSSDMGDYEGLAGEMIDSKVMKEFSAAYRNYGLAPPPEEDRLSSDFPYTPGRDSFDVELSSRNVKGGGVYTGGAMSYTLTAVSRLQGAKILTQGTVNDARGVELYGYFKSPFEPRIAVVFAVGVAAFEGETATHILFAGCRLDTGFKKR